MTAGSHWSRTPTPATGPTYPVRHHDRPSGGAAHRAGRALNGAPASTRDPRRPRRATTPPQMTVVFDAGRTQLPTSRTWPRPGWGSSAGSTVGLRGPAGPPGYRPTRRGPRPVPRRDRAGPPPRLRRRSARRAHPLPVPAHRRDPRLRPDHGHGNREVVRLATPSPRSHPPSPRKVSAEITTSSNTPGYGASCPGNCPATPPPSTGSASTSTIKPAPPGDRGLRQRALMTYRDQWSTADVVAGYRSQSEAEFGFRQLRPRRRLVQPDAPLTEHTSACTSSPAYWPCRSPT